MEICFLFTNNKTRFVSFSSPLNVISSWKMFIRVEGLVSYCLIFLVKKNIYYLSALTVCILWILHTLYFKLLFAKIFLQSFFTLIFNLVCFIWQTQSLLFFSEITIVDKNKWQQWEKRYIFITIYWSFPLPPIPMLYYKCFHLNFDGGGRGMSSVCYKNQSRHYFCPRLSCNVYYLL